jgi:hypothetical protein
VKGLREEEEELHEAAPTLLQIRIVQSFAGKEQQTRKTQDEIILTPF